MNSKNLFILSAVCAVCGALMYALHQGWIIVNSPRPIAGQLSEPVRMPAVIQKKLFLYFWHHDAWHHETTQLVWSNHSAQNICYLINSWLSLLDDEKLTIKKVTLQTAMIDPSNNELYISFDRSLFSKEATTYEKWMLIEGLLKTLQENGITTPRIHFLIHHQPMLDPHLDFTSPWPLSGFLGT